MPLNSSKASPWASPELVRAQHRDSGTALVIVEGGFPRSVRSKAPHPFKAAGLFSLGQTLNSHNRNNQYMRLCTLKVVDSPGGDDENTSFRGQSGQPPDG